MKSKFLKLNIAWFVLLLATACNKLDLAPTDRFTELNYWTSADKAALVLNTAYKDMTKSEYFFYNEALSDNVFTGRGDASSSSTISSGLADASTARFFDEWGFHYAGIKTCNVFMEFIDQVPNMDEALRARMKGECRFIRAFHYFQLTTWFGDVPLFDKDISLEASKVITRTPKAEVLTFVINELNAAAESLPVKEGYAASDLGRITKGAAIGLLARVYLYNSQWDLVVSTCKKLIDTPDNGNYSLFASYEGLFSPSNENNSEVILDHEYVNITRTWSDLYDMVPLSVGGRVNSMAPTQELVDDYLMTNGKTINDPASGYVEDNPYVNRDPRLSSTVVYNLFQWKKPDNTLTTIYIKPGSDPDRNDARDEYVSGGNATSTGYYIRKYYDPQVDAGFNSGLNLILIRYADILLMYAEAQNELDQMTPVVWTNTIQALRARAGFVDPDALAYDNSLTKEQMRAVIHKERRCELALEGLRIFDLRRWKTAEIVLNGNPHGAKFGDPSIDNGYIRLAKRTFDPARNYLWPIPRAERDLDPNLGQNPGWGN